MRLIKNVLLISVLTLTFTVVGLSSAQDTEQSDDEIVNSFLFTFGGMSESEIQQEINSLEASVDSLSGFEQYITLITIAEAYDTLGDADAAFAAINRAIEIRPDQAASYYLRGTFYEYAANDNEAALEDYNRAVELNPEFAWGYAARGRYYQFAEGDFDLALADYEQAIELTPEGESNPIVTTLNSRSILKRNQGDFAGALADIQTALEYFDYRPGYVNLVLALYNIGDYQAVIEASTTALELYPNDGFFFQLRGLGYYFLEDYDAALEDYDYLVSIAPDNASYLGNRSAINLAAGDYEQSISDATSALEINPELQWILNNRAEAYNELGDYDSAAQDFLAYLNAYNDEFEDARRIAIGEFVFIDFEDDVPASLTFSANAGDFVSITARALDEEGDPLFVLVSPTEVAVVGEDDIAFSVSNDAEFLNIRLPEDGEYTLIVDQEGNGLIEVRVTEGEEVITVPITATNNINVRSGPSTDNGVVGVVETNQTIEADARNEAGDWVRINLAEEGETPEYGWVFVSLFTTNGDVMILPVVNP